MRRRRSRASAHALLAPEMGLHRLARARQTGLYPVEFILRGRRQPTPVTVHVYTAHGDPAGVATALPLVPFHASRRRTIVYVPEGALQWVLRSVDGVVADGALTISAPAALPPRAPPSGLAEPTGAKASAPVPGGNGFGLVRFSFSDAIGFSVRDVVVELLLPTVRVLCLRPASPGVYTGSLFLPPGHCTYRFRVLNSRPVRRDAKCPMTSLGWDFDSSYDWGLASNWCEVSVPGTEVSNSTEEEQLPQNPAGSSQNERIIEGSDEEKRQVTRSISTSGADERVRSYDAVLSWCQSGAVDGAVAVETRQGDDAVLDPAEPSPIILGSSSGDASPNATSISNEAQRSFKGLRKAMSVLSSWRSRTINSHDETSEGYTSGGRTPPHCDVPPIPASSQRASPAFFPCQRRAALKRRWSWMSKDGSRTRPFKRTKFSSSSTNGGREHKAAREKRDRVGIFVRATGKLFLFALVSAAAEHFLSRAEPAERSRQYSTDEGVGP